MHLKITSVLAISSIALLLTFVGATAGCGSTDYLYVKGHAPIPIPPRSRNYENPDKYLVKSVGYPTYVAKYDFAPPKPRDRNWVSSTSNVEILTTDVWHVTHKFGNRLLIFSNTYQDRQCNYLVSLGRAHGAFKSLLGGRCVADNLYELYISGAGKVIGWMFLKDPEKVAFSKDRYTIMDPARRKGPGWPKQPLFAPVH